MSKRTRSVFSFDHGVFDLDGTLVDSMGACTGIFARLVASRGVDPDAATRSYLSNTTRSLEETFRETLAEHGAEHEDETVARMMLWFAELIKREHLDFFPGAKRLVRRLKEAGKTLFVSSGSPDEVVCRRLGAERIKGLFQLVLGSTDIVKGREHIRLFAEEAGLTTAEFGRAGFLIGDLELDMMIARETGLYGIGVATTISAERLRAAGARRIIPDIKTLLSDPV